MSATAQLYTDQPRSELISALQLSKPDSTRLQILYQLTRKYYFERSNDRKSFDSVLLFLQEAQQLSKYLHSLKWQPEIYCYLGKYYRRTGDIQQAGSYESKAADFINRIGGPSDQIQRWEQLGWNIAVLDSIGITRINCFEKMKFIYQQQGQAEKVIKMQEEIADTRMKQGKLDIAEAELSDVLKQYNDIGFRQLHYTYNLLAVTNRLKGNYDKALHFALRTIESVRQTGDSTQQATFYGHLAFLYHELGQTGKSIEYYKVYFGLDHQGKFNFYFFREASFYVADLIKNNLTEEAGRFLVHFSKNYPPSDQYSKAILTKTYADYYNAVGQYSLADQYSRQMIDQEESLGKNNEITRDVRYSIGEFFFRKRQFGSAGTYFTKALDEALLNNSANTIKNIHLMLFKTDSSLGNYVQAINHLNQFRQLNDSIFTQTKIREAEDVQVKYETEKKEKDIKLLEQERNLQAIKLSKASVTRNWILGGAALLLVIMGLLIYNARLKQISTRKEAQQQNEIKQQNISLRHLVDEKEWLLKEIHHRVKNNLQLVMSLLSSQSAFIDNAPALAAIRDSQHRVHAMSLIHQKLYNSENLSSIDMSFYIRELTSYLRDSLNAGQHIHFEYSIETLEMDVSQAIPLGLILNEAITNAIKYAFPDDRAGVISISLAACSDRQLLLSVSDNGIGIPPDFSFNIRKPGSLGMSLIEGLSADLQGKFMIQNNNGTAISISFVHKPVKLAESLA
jgi:two-component sensor histidine kinase